MVQKKVIAKLQTMLTPRNLAFFMTVIYVLSLIPMLWIGMYNYPSADDYTNGMACHKAWIGEKSIIGILEAAWGRMIDEWFTWRGCFTASFLSAIVPSAFGESLYKLTIWIVIGILSLATSYLLHTIFVKGFGADKYLSHSITILTLFITIQCMVGKVEAFYWYSGAVNYMVLHGLSLLFYGLLMDAFYCKKMKQKVLLGIATPIGFLVGGGNQMTPLNVAIILTSAMVIIVYKKKWKVFKAWLIPVGMFFVGFALNLIAPGNYVRATETAGYNPIKAILVSFYYCLDFVIDEWTTWPIIVWIIVLCILFWKMLGKSNFDFAYPGVAILFGFCVVSAMFTPPLFAVGNVEAPRIQALTFAMYILVLTLCVGYVIGWIRRKWEKREKQLLSDNDSFSINEVVCLLGFGVFFGIATLITVIPEPHYFTFSSAVTDLANGSAKAYADALEERLELYNSGEQDVVVEPLPAQPKLLYFSDIKPDPQDWENSGLCRYYGINSVRVEEKTAK